jgi:hypothetical protein
MNSEEFDTYLYIGMQQPGYFEAYDYNDDFGGSLNARLRFVAPMAGTYTVQATSFSPDTTGAYTLSVAEAVIVPPPVPIALSSGQTVSGSLSTNGPTLDESGQPYALYTYEATEGEMATFEMTSNAGYGYLELGMDTEWGFEPYYAASDDDGDMVATMTFRFPMDGIYTLRAIGAVDTASEYSISVEPFAVAEEPRPTRIRMNQIMRGSLDEGEVINQNMQIYDVYQLNVREGQEVRITMRATDAEQYFDPYLEVGVNTPLGFAVAAVDDDSGAGVNGLDAQVEFTAQDSGTLIIRATGLVPMQGGSYSISVE